MGVKTVRVSQKPKPYLVFEISIKNLAAIEKTLELKGYTVEYEDGRPVQVKFPVPDEYNSWIVAPIDSNQQFYIGKDDEGKLQIVRPEAMKNDYDFEEIHG